VGLEYRLKENIKFIITVTERNKNKNTNKRKSKGKEKKTIRSNKQIKYVCFRQSDLGFLNMNETGDIASLLHITFSHDTESVVMMNIHT